MSINLIQGDCLEVMKSIPDGSIDAIITDPPYGTTACKWDSVIPFEPMWEQLNRIIKPNGAIVLFGSEPFSSALRMSNIKNYKYDWIWNKINKFTGFQIVSKRPMKDHEIISVFYLSQCTYNKQLRDGGYKTRVTVDRSSETIPIKNEKKDVGRIIEGLNPKMIIDIKGQNTLKSKQFHPTQKPVTLMEYLIKTYTNEKETVLDFTMGSGSTGVACKNLNRNFIGIEQDEKYFNIAKDRINEY